MSFSNTENRLRALPKGYAAIPISEDQKSVLLKICVLVKTEPDDVAGHLVVLRDTMDAKVFLGCIVDSCGQMQEWLELWIQNSGSLVDTVSAARQVLSNTMLDNRWRRQCQALEEIEGAAIVKTGWESEQPLPTFLDLSEKSPVHPVEANSGAAWKLCTDEGMLQQKDLPGYGNSLHRYLHVSKLGGDSPLVPVTPGAPTNDSTKPMSEICGDPARNIPLNPQAGLMLVKKYVPIKLDTFVDILSGKPWDGLKHGRSILDLGEAFKALSKDEPTLSTDGWLFLETQGRCGRLIETLHLKLRLLADIVSSVRSLMYHLQRPLLNISPESWQVELGEPGRGLPFFWTARVVLNDAGDAVPLVIEKSDFKYYLPARTPGTSVYLPLVTSLPTQGRASIRIRQVLPDTSDTTVVEGTFTTQERIEIAKNDLLWFRLNLACGDINLYAHLEKDSAMAAGEWRFRTVAQNVHDTRVSHLRKAEGVPIADVPFEIIPLLSSPYDLYSLAVMAVRILLVDNTNSLPVTLDETLSLLHQIEAEYDESDGLEQQISELFKGDQRWRQALGPQHLTFDEITPDEAFSLIPSELWLTTLATVLRMFPGPGPCSECRDYGDAPQGGLHKVFEKTMNDLDNLILRTRSFIVADWKSNQEIASVIQKFLV
ncbi:MAG: hypothetical protein ACYSUY_11700 [Planctomycetota bacterium]